MFSAPGYCIVIDNVGKEPVSRHMGIEEKVSELSSSDFSGE
jgi:hypothetical protein